MTETIKNVLVTGGSGKIGRSLIPGLVKTGYRVRATEFRTPVTFDGVEVVKGSVSDEAFVKKVVDGVDAIVHLATQKEDKEALVDVSVRGTLNLLEACRDNHRMKQFIISSGDAAQGIFFYPNPVPISENMPPRAYRGYYALSKVLEDTLVEQYGIQYGVPWTILRFSWIHDEDDLLCYMTFAKPDFGGPSWKSLATTPEQEAYFAEGRDGVGCLVHPGGKPYVRHIVAVDDVVHSILTALGNPQALCETFNVAAPAAFSYDVLSGYIGEKLDLPVVDFELEGSYDFSIDISKARAVLGYAPEHDVFRMVDEAIAFRESGKPRTDTHYGG